MTTNDYHWLHSGYILTISDYILAIFRLHTDYIQTTFWLHFCYIHSDCILKTFWLHSDYILTTIPATFWLHTDYIQTTFWLHRGLETPKTSKFVPKKCGRGAVMPPIPETFCRQRKLYDLLSREAAYNTIFIYQSIWPNLMWIHFAWTAQLTTTFSYNLENLFVLYCWLLALNAQVTPSL